MMRRDGGRAPSRLEEIWIPGQSRSRPKTPRGSQYDAGSNAGPVSLHQMERPRATAG